MSIADGMNESELREWCGMLSADNKRLQAALDDNLRAEPPAQPISEERLRWLERTYGPRAPLPGVEYGMTAELMAAHTIMLLVGEIRRPRAPVAWSKEPPTEPGYYWAKRRDDYDWEPVEVRSNKDELEVVYIDDVGHPLEDVMCAWGPRLTPPAPKEKP